MLQLRHILSVQVNKTQSTVSDYSVGKRELTIYIGFVLLGKLVLIIIKQLYC